MSEAFDLERDEFTLSPRYRFQWEEAQGCHVLLYPEGMVKLSGSAGEILSRCLRPVTREGLIEDLRKAYPGADTLAADVVEFLEQAREQEWIVRAGD